MITQLETLQNEFEELLNKQASENSETLTGVVKITLLKLCFA